MHAASPPDYSEVAVRQWMRDLTQIGTIDGKEPNNVVLETNLSEYSQINISQGNRAFEDVAQIENMGTDQLQYTDRFPVANGMQSFRYEHMTGYATELLEYVIPGHSVFLNECIDESYQAVPYIGKDEYKNSEIGLNYATLDYPPDSVNVARLESAVMNEEYALGMGPLEGTAVGDAIKNKYYPNSGDDDGLQHLIDDNGQEVKCQPFEESYISVAELVQKEMRRVAADSGNFLFKKGTCWFDSAQEELNPLDLSLPWQEHNDSVSPDPRQLLLGKAAGPPCRRLRYRYRRAEDDVEWDPAHRPGLDGHCLYSCLAWHAWRQTSVRAAKAMRKRLAVFLLRPESGDILSSWAAWEGLDEESYILDYVIHGWGGSPEIQAFSKLFNVTVNILDKNEQHCYTFKAGPSLLTLEYQKQHYKVIASDCLTLKSLMKKFNPTSYRGGGRGDRRHDSRDRKGRGSVILKTKDEVKQERQTRQRSPSSDVKHYQAEPVQPSSSSHAGASSAMQTPQNQRRSRSPKHVTWGKPAFIKEEEPQKKMFSYQAVKDLWKEDVDCYWLVGTSYGPFCLFCAKWIKDNHRQSQHHQAIVENFQLIKDAKLRADFLENAHQWGSKVVEQRGKAENIMERIRAEQAKADDPSRSAASSSSTKRPRSPPLQTKVKKETGGEKASATSSTPKYEWELRTRFGMICTFCGKWTDDMHRRSNAHIKKVQYYSDLSKDEKAVHLAESKTWALQLIEQRVNRGGAEDETPQALHRHHRHHRAKRRSRVLRRTVMHSLMLTSPSSY